MQTIIIYLIQLFTLFYFRKYYSKNVISKMPSYEFQNPIDTKFRMSDFWTMQRLKFELKVMWATASFSPSSCHKEYLKEAPLETAV